MATGYISKISGPIPNHNIYENDREHAERNYSDVKGKEYLRSLNSRNVNSKDHIQENVKKIKEIQRANRMRKDICNSRGPMKPTAHDISYSNVWDKPSRPQSSTLNGYERNVFKGDDNKQGIPRSMLKIPIGRSEGNIYSAVESERCGKHRKIYSPSYHSERGNQREFLRAHEKTGPPLELQSYHIKPIPKHPREEKLTVPKASTAREVRFIRRDVDFVRANAYAASSARLKRSPSADSLLHLKNRKEEKMTEYRRGEVPSYLIKRRQQWKEHEENLIANQPDPEQPKGHCKMAEKERIATLDLLKSTEKELLAEFGRLPIRTDTLKLKNRKQEIEQKLSELEEAIKIFSKPKVFIRVDDSTSN